MTEKDVINLVIFQAKQHGVRELARRWGLSPAYIVHVMKGRTRPGHSILRSLGLERIVSYRHVDLVTGLAE